MIFCDIEKEAISKRSKLFIRFLKYNLGWYKFVSNVFDWLSRNANNSSFHGKNTTVLLENLSAVKIPGALAYRPHKYTIDIVDELLNIYRLSSEYTSFHKKFELTLDFKTMEKLYDAIIKFDEEQNILNKTK